MRQLHSTQRYEPVVVNDEQALTNDIVGLATQFGSCGYRRITAMPRSADWEVNHRRVERYRPGEWLKAPARQPRRGRLRPNDGSSGGRGPGQERRVGL